MRKKIVLHNPHSFDMLFTPVSYRVARKKPHLKYCHIPKILNEHNGFVECVVDYSESSLLPSSVLTKLPLLFRIVLVNIELIFWKKLNSEYRFKIYTHNNLPEGYSLLSFSYKAYDSLTSEKTQVFGKCSRLLSHLSHYMINTSVKSGNMSLYRSKILLLADNDFSNNTYFNKFFSWYKHSIIVLPFIVQDRFVNYNNADRKNRILLSGTIHDLSMEKPDDFYTDFINHFNSYSYHRLRSSKMIQDLEYVDNLTSSFRDKNGSTLQRGYFKVDLVQRLNEYKYVCYDTELSGALALSSLEAIACGCVPFVTSESIKGLEFNDKFDYFEIDGTEKEFIRIGSSTCFTWCSLFFKPETISTGFRLPGFRGCAEEVRPGRRVPAQDALPGGHRRRRSRESFIS